MKIGLIGSGNLSNHLGPLLLRSGHSIVEVTGRNETTTRALAKKLKCGYNIGSTGITAKADLYLIAVPDHEIKEVIRQFPHKQKPIAHTSGSVALDVFPSNYVNAGVFYPLQTFSKQRKLKHTSIPICIEGRSRSVSMRLKKLAGTITDKVVTIDSGQRLWLHLTAVLVNNFPNHLFVLAEKLLHKHGMDFELLRPLIAETAEKVMTTGPLLAQTGPARRGDSTTIDKHLKLLKGHPRLQTVYQFLSESIEELQGPQL